MSYEHISSHEVMVTLSLTHNSNLLLIFLALKLCILTVTIPLTGYLLLLHTTHHFLTSLISYVNIFIYYFPLNAAGKFLSTHPSSLTDVLLTFATFSQLKLSCPLSRLLTTLVYHRVHSAVDKIALLVLTLLTVLRTILSSLLVQPVKSSHT